MAALLGARTQRRDQGGALTTNGTSTFGQGNGNPASLGRREDGLDGAIPSCHVQSCWCSCSLVVGCLMGELIDRD